MARTHTFKGSATAGYGYAAFIEEGQLVITEDWGREGGVLYRGSYRDAGEYLARLHKNAPKLYKSITEYYTAGAYDETGKFALISEKCPAEETITHQFKDSRDCYGYGYHAFIENGQLVICHEAPREGGVLFRGTYFEATKILRQLQKEDKVLYEDIDKYFTKHDPDTLEDLAKKYDFDDKTKTVLFKVKLHKKNRVVHKVLVRGRFQADVIKKLMPSIPEVLTLQTPTGDVFAIRSDEISAVEFVDEFSTDIEFH
ncbi:MAG: hypothetical protein IJV71_07035 [Lachnospiraceae bacterium]|nr:hypothetical protein [Lachnospiraceae bacterium]